MNKQNHLPKGLWRLRERRNQQPNRRGGITHTHTQGRHEPNSSRSKRTKSPQKGKHEKRARSNSPSSSRSAPRNRHSRKDEPPRRARTSKDKICYQYTSNYRRPRSPAKGRRDTMSISPTPKRMLRDDKRSRPAFKSRPERGTRTPSPTWPNKANLSDLIAANGLVILLKLDSNHRLFSPCDLEIWWMI